jgi:transcriptional regulator with XRE-family HTH domain
MEICIKDNLRRLRTEKNITQEALAKYLGITPQSVGKWERGEGYPDITLLPKIALFFGVTIDDLLNVGKAHLSFPNDTAKNFKGNTCNLLLNMLRTRQYIFGPLTEDARYEKVVAQLEEYAET